MNHHTAAHAGTAAPSTPPAPPVHADTFAMVTDVPPDGMTTELARQQSAMHCVRLAVQRWRTGALATEPVMPSSQERWFAEAHGRFTAWLTAGGFAQDGMETPEAPPVHAETAQQQQAAAVRHDAGADANACQHGGIAA